MDNVSGRRCRFQILKPFRQHEMQATSLVAPDKEMAMTKLNQKMKWKQVQAAGRLLCIVLRSIGYSLVCDLRQAIESHQDLSESCWVLGQIPESGPRIAQTVAKYDSNEMICENKQAGCECEITWQLTKIIRHGCQSGRRLLRRQAHPRYVRVSVEYFL